MIRIPYDRDVRFGSGPYELIAADYDEEPERDEEEEDED